jgi:RHS repeat-associated protein
LATNASGGIEWQARYKPFGETRWTSGTLTTNRKFNGMKEEASLGGIYDFNARFYDPAIGRFLSADTVVPRPSDPQSLNRFAFVYNRPLVATDPTGHDVAFVFGGGEDIRMSGGAAGFFQWIAVYKGWTLAQAKAWGEKWDAASAANRTTMEHADGITFISYGSGTVMCTVNLLCRHNPMLTGRG